MSEHDPLDDLLRRAFAADRARAPAPTVSEQVISRIRRRQRVRSLVMGVALLAGTSVASLSAASALETLLQSFAALMPAGWATRDLGLVMLAAVGAASLLALEPELE